MKTRFLTTIVLLLSCSVKAQYAEYAGIWQDISDTSKYYSVQINGDRMVFVDMKGLESSAYTLRSAYLGDIFINSTGHLTARLTVLSEHQGMSRRVTLHMLSPSELHVSWGCPPESENCVGIVDYLRKIF